MHCTYIDYLIISMMFKSKSKSFLQNIEIHGSLKMPTPPCHQCHLQTTNIMEVKSN